ncbi:MAG TPA: PspC domain-containing protein [Roseiflexaceae bacterium]|nr:PspC domain-containing protein [Roseiflexaceae bacterium]
MTTSTQFMRSRNDRIIAGVCGGIARYLNIDPTIVRLVFVLAVFLGGASPLIYLVLWLVMPEERAFTATNTTVPQHTLPATDHPRPAEEWKYDPYTGERIRQ